MVHKSVWVVPVVAAGFVIGCGQSGGPDRGREKADPAALAAGKKYLLAEEPAGAAGVLEARKQVKDGDEVVLVGHIAGKKKPFVEGRAAFTVLDLSIPPCPDEEACPTPWDCCCTPEEELLAAMTQVKFLGEDGKTLDVGAKELFGVRELSVVVVKGRASRDDAGNLTVVASGLYPREKK